MKKIRSFIKKVLLLVLNIAFNIIDLFIPKRSDYWIFPVYFLGEGNFSDNMLAVFENVKMDSRIKKIILTKKKKISIEDAINVEIVKISSFKAAWFLMRAKLILVQHSIWVDLSWARFQIIFPFRRIIINLWHGIVVKDLSHPSTDLINFRSKLEMNRYKVICSSESDKKIMKKSFYKTNINDFWLTGLPRNDFLVLPEQDLPNLYKDELSFLKNKLKGKKLIIYTPTYRELKLGGSYYAFTSNELNKLKSYLQKNNAILGLRYHSYLQPGFIKDLIDDEYFIDLSSDVVSDVRMLIREASIIITDYSSIYIDAIYLQKKLISFAYDLDHYLNIQRGFYYDFNTVFPGIICKTFEELMQSLVKFKEPLTEDDLEKFKNVETLFFKHLDSNNTQRVVDRINSLIKL